MLLKVWFRQSWTDPRLVWSPGDYDNVTSAYFRAASRYDGASNNRGVNEIWLPDIRPYNLGEGFEDTLQPSDVLVNHTGGAFWSRPGVMDVLCKFDGLARFPFDHKLTCPIDVGGWMLDGQRQRVGLLDGGYEGDFVEDDVDSSATLVEASAGSSFTEWDLLSLSAVVRNLTYVCCGDDPWPVVLRNASFFYFYVLIFPPTTLAILAISVFFVSPAVGERLSFGVTLVVASQFGACKLVVMQLMPICSELLWVDVFLLINELVTLLSLLESTLVLFLHHYELLGLFQAAPQTAAVEESGAPAEREQSRAESKAERGSDGRDAPSGDGPTPGGDAIAGPSAELGSVGHKAAAAVAAADTEVSPVVEAALAEAAVRAAGATAARGRGTKYHKRRFRLHERQAQRLLYYEKLFFVLDNDGAGYVDGATADRFLSFVAFELDAPTRRRRILEAVSFDLDAAALAAERPAPVARRWSIEAKATMRLRGGELFLSRMQFVQLCMGTLGRCGLDKPLEEVQMAFATFDMAHTVGRRRALAYWRGVGRRIDAASRVVFTVGYSVGLLALYNLNRESAPLWSMSALSILATVATPCAVVATFGACLWARSMRQRTRAQGMPRMAVEAVAAMRERRGGAFGESRGRSFKTTGDGARV
ncbi:hypothetical protein EMIHUDRAFT_448130 [Emiliania huxleyi CCMP1516]|uniref:Neurotransmitter-gated ion-channel ligand-binding domain-containing protein n=2 Tax=Emiliania huxleyi TaxID=2903 RepID=A0A0D3ITJ1_EMIH1|nr:hypothetical protein EMIHUDRAFT_448130 [Emiliania huxleyi CCMP1516]EOD14576.1 hypothetical protein EMIHUDRAFT_448130 [Emiliania huxleyi CCMP1516]|eukprot:XP_005767005.1 hypothetical protein EMIHUDRAFT_448130 [Emiliania huxleyi CCMP1516]